MFELSVILGGDVAVDCLNHLTQLHYPLWHFISMGIALEVVWHILGRSSPLQFGMHAQLAAALADHQDP